MTKYVASHVFKDPLASADAESVTFLVDGQLYVFRMSRTALQRLGRQIDAALKLSSPPARKPKA